MTAHTTDVAVVGAGFAGLLAARELARAGRSVTVLERGAPLLDAGHMPYHRREADISTAKHNHEHAPRSLPHPWQYGYGLGGSSLLWAGVAPRLMPSDFELHSRHGVGRDWPFGYEELLPFYREAEEALRVAGEPLAVFPGSDSYPLSPVAPSPADELLATLLAPFGALAQARPQGAERSYPPEAGGPDSPIDPCFSMLELLAEPSWPQSVRLMTETAVASLKAEGGRIGGLDCLTARGERIEVRADHVVLAAGGLENPGILLRSGPSRRPVGRWLSDHTHVVFSLELNRLAGHGRAAARDSGVSFAWADGPWRDEMASAIVVPYNPGLQVRDRLVAALSQGRGGSRLRDELRTRFERTLVVYASLEDLPREDRRVELSPNRDALGLPLNRISYSPDSDYVQRAIGRLRSDLEKKLRPLGARISGQSFGNRGGHSLGACFAGEDGVVDANLRHHDYPNLFVVGGSAFPTYSALHPTLTISALAIRLGRHVAATRP